MIFANAKKSLFILDLYSIHTLVQQQWANDYTTAEAELHPW